MINQDAEPDDLPPLDPEAPRLRSRLSSRVVRPPLSSAVVRVADFGATFVFAAEGGLSAALAGLDPIGVLVLAFLTGLGGGVIRDLLMARGRPAAVSDSRYTLVVLAGAAAGWLLVTAPWIRATPAVVTIDAAGLALGAVAGTEKALENRVHPVVCVFLGGLAAVGGGMLRDIMLNQVPRVLHADIYASAALLAAVIVVGGRAVGVGARWVAVAGGLACFALRMAAWANGWNLPAAVVHAH